MASAGGDWTFDDLNGFLHKPKKWLPGTIMAYAGTKKDTDRANLIMYLRSLSDAPVPIPAAPVAEPAQEAVDIVPTEALELPAAGSQAE